MHKALLLVAFLSLAGPLRAADPIVGSWKLDLATSTLSQMGQVEKQTNTIRELDADYELTILRTGPDGSKDSLILTFPKQGGKAVVPQAFQSQGLQMIVSRIGAGNWCFTILQNDRQVSLSHVVMDQDGKTAVEYSIGVDTQGATVEGKGTFTRQ